MNEINLIVKFSKVDQALKHIKVHRILKQYDISSNHLILTYIMFFKT